MRLLSRALRRTARLHLATRPFTAGIAALPPTALEALGTNATAAEAIAYNRGRVAAATGIALYRCGHRLPMPDDHLDDAVRALDFPYSVPSSETRAAIRAAIAVLEADPAISVQP
ncbi:hypothetical protein [Streptomyces flavofungini]|uniref:hypothetical protein n=1 Tax=Streptomyces flavofungini TaxID=68200 RepID=UPI0019A39F6B|nr:hypothetical protein [Streptomyces flavofungini]GHC88553.1 hypothetical protein GCM10010349_75910 [Streptomyces flavofungini]